RRHTAPGDGPRESLDRLQATTRRRGATVDRGAGPPRPARTGPGGDAHPGPAHTADRRGLHGGQPVETRGGGTGREEGRLPVAPTGVGQERGGGGRGAGEVEGVEGDGGRGNRATYGPTDRGAGGRSVAGVGEAVRRGPVAVVRAVARHAGFRRGAGPGRVGR